MLVLRSLNIFELATGDTLAKMICTVDVQLIAVHKKLRVLAEISSLGIWLCTDLGTHSFNRKVCSKAAGSNLHGIQSSHDARC